MFWNNSYGASVWMCWEACERDRRFCVRADSAKSLEVVGGERREEVRWLRAGRPTQQKKPAKKKVPRKKVTQQKKAPRVPSPALFGLGGRRAQQRLTSTAR